MSTQDNSDKQDAKPAEDVKADAPAAPATEAAATPEAPKPEAAPAPATPAPEAAKAEGTPATDAPAPAAPKPDAPAPAAAKTEAPSADKPKFSPRGGDRPSGPRRDNNSRDRGGRRDRRDEKAEDDLAEKVVFINRCSKVVKGGRRFSFSALLVSGDHKGQVGFGFGKANEVAEAIRKASEISRRSLTTMSIVDGTIPHEIYAEFGGAKILLKPAAPGTGVIAGGGMRAVCEAVGIKDVIGKSIGSNNHANVVKATLKGLSLLSTREETMALRGKKIKAKESI